jgi:hypothetical protein
MLLSCLFILIGCVAQKEYKYDNPFELGKIALRSIVGDKEMYIYEEVVVGPIIIVSHDLSRNIYEMSPIDIKGIIDNDVKIDMYYGKVSDKSDWINAQVGDILFVRGAIVYYKYTTEIYFHALEIKYLDHKEIKQ